MGLMNQLTAVIEEMQFMIPKANEAFSIAQLLLMLNPSGSITLYEAEPPNFGVETARSNGAVRL